MTEFDELSEQERQKLASEAKERFKDIVSTLTSYSDSHRIYGFHPNPIQAELLEAWDDPRKKVFTFTGANRIGKTSIGTIIAEAVMFGRFLFSEQRLHFPHNRPRKIRYIGQDWEKHIKAVVVPELHTWWPADRPKQVKKNNQGVDALWTDEKTGSTLEIMSNLQPTDLHEGWSGDLIVYDEPPKREIRVANARGLIDREGRELFSMTLLKEAWVNTDIIRARTEDGRPDPTVYNVHGDIYVNIGYGITEGGVEQFKRTLTEDEIRARIYGIPSYMSGLVLPMVSRKIHYVNRFEVPLDWIVDIAIDVHPRENQAVLFVATSPNGFRYAIEEIWDHHSPTALADAIVRRINRGSYRVNKVIIDPLSKGDPNVGETTFDKIDLRLSQHGYTLDIASKDKDSGIAEIKDHLKGANNTPSLFFFDDLIRTTFELESWMYDEDSQKPQKKDDHMMENLYRILLENTVYYPPGEIEDDYAGTTTKNKWTGY
jgi:hypothetical protein